MGHCLESIFNFSFCFHGTLLLPKVSFMLNLVKIPQLSFTCPIASICNIYMPWLPILPDLIPLSSSSCLSRHTGLTSFCSLHTPSTTPRPPTTGPLHKLFLLQELLGNVFTSQESLLQETSLLSEISRPDFLHQWSLDLYHQHHLGTC